MRSNHGASVMKMIQEMQQQQNRLCLHFRMGLIVPPSPDALEGW